MSTRLAVKRVYEAPAASDGLRVLVDRLWPRGLSRENARIDEWRKDLAPSHELRKWFGHDPARWDEFRVRYARELEGRSEELGELRLAAKTRRVTLLFGARDRLHNQAVALAEILSAGSSRKGQAVGDDDES